MRVKIQITTASAEETQLIIAQCQLIRDQYARALEQGKINADAHLAQFPVPFALTFGNLELTNARAVAISWEQLPPTFNCVRVEIEYTQGSKP